MKAWQESFDKGIFRYDLMGRISWEIPRGMGKKGESGAQTASREASEEMGGIVTHEYDGGWLVSNTTFEPHQTKLTLGRVDTSKAPLPKDKFEDNLGKAKFLSLDEIFKMEMAGDVYDAYTLSGIHRFEQMLKAGLIKP
jgi:8-oxo-dGTP pyrophosphatase MutT (NUDIX family)